MMWVYYLAHNSYSFLSVFSIVICIKRPNITPEYSLQIWRIPPETESNFMIFYYFFGFLSIIFEWNLRGIVKSCERADEKRGRKWYSNLRNGNSELFEGFERFSRHIHLRVEQHTIVDEVLFRAALAPKLGEFSLLCDDLVSLPLHLRCAMIAERQTLQVTTNASLWQKLTVWMVEWAVVLDCARRRVGHFGDEQFEWKNRSVNEFEYSMSNDRFTNDECFQQSSNLYPNSGRERILQNDILQRIYSIVQFCALIH